MGFNEVKIERGRSRLICMGGDFHKNVHNPKITLK